ncbi:MAG TPA: prolyl oligopeptidase family serine peptidase, partial [Nitriliruptorales bacterium]|nr:prolyl oligopeptidase family serine peptidase [Nitriliruptorales bacterium]
LFLRSFHGEDRVNRLWSLDLPRGSERLLADPTALLGEVDGEVPAEELARRERRRETGGGIVAYAGDENLTRVAFALAGRLFVTDVDSGRTRPLDVTGPVFDPRPDPTGRRVAYVSGGDLYQCDVDGGAPRRLAGEPAVRWGVADFVAAEEMGRERGYWWSPDGRRLAVARVDERPVGRWWLTDPVDPTSEPTCIAYPAAGTANPDVTLWVVDLDGQRRRVDWPSGAFPYLAVVRWSQDGGRQRLTLLVQSRDQRTVRVLVVDPATGTTETVHEQTDDAWVDLVDGVPAWLPDGRLVVTTDLDDTRRVLVDGRPVSPPGLHVRRVLDVSEGGILVSASAADPTAVHVVRLAPDGGEPVALTSDPGVHDAVAAGDLVVVLSSTLATTHPEVSVQQASRTVARIAGHGAAPVLEPDVELLELGARRLRAALLRPSDDPGGPLPVLLDPYGGPHAQRVLRARSAFLAPQWFADQGFAVLVVDGRGTPGRGPIWERAVHLDLAGPALEDQVDALHAAVEHEPRLDLDRVAIRGWSFGGYLAALAVLRRPDVFHAAVAGAPVTDWRLYDTHYTERYLGDPHEQPAAYRRSSLLDDARRLRRPLLLLHGLADDNVVAAHSLRLSRALLEAGRPHAFVPLSGITHMTPQEVVAENLLLLQVAFLRDALGLR